MRPSISLVFLVALASRTFADVKFTSPAAGASIPGGTAFTVTWEESGDAPSISDLTAYQLFLYSGSNTAPLQLFSLGAAAFSAGNSITATVPVGTGGNNTHAYFLGMISTAAAGGTVTDFSSRFTLTNMTGTFSQTVLDALSTVSGNTGPAPINNVASNAETAMAPEGMFGTPYNLQTGPTRYAPMQQPPPTSITATNTEPLWPTSSVVLASTFLPIPSVVTTITQSDTFIVSPHTNTVSAAPQPSDDMAKFLNRWKD